MVREFYAISFAVFMVVGLIAIFWPPVLWILIVLVPVFISGVLDTLQPYRAVKRNYPVVGTFRYMFEAIRPEINQYFIESNTDGTPIDREKRSLVYQRAKLQLETVPFGTQRDVYEIGYEWINHSMAAIHGPEEEPRVVIGAGRCAQPYSASLLNVAAMSYGSLSGAAVRSLSGGARAGKFAVNTGEGSISSHHLDPGGDIIWQIGTGYFGCRDADGNFDRELFAQRARQPTVKMIEIKLSQGAKPGHGGILPACKITPEISKIRHVPMGQDVLSPPAHSAFRTPRELMAFITELRELSGGKPIGVKLCLGNPSEFLGMCMAMRESGQVPDFIAIDGGEGGTGAAPLEFSNSVGAPLTDGLVFAHNALVGFGLRGSTKLIASGKVITGFNMVSRMAAGADLCYSARAFMLSLGCIQARVCNSNRCPVGVATQNVGLERGLVVADKTVRVANFHAKTIEAFLELLGAAGLDHPDDLQPWHIYRRVSQTEIKTYDQIYSYLDEGALLDGVPPEGWNVWMMLASPDSFVPPSEKLARS